MTQLTEFIHDVAFSFDQGLQVDVVFSDFNKAFDVVLCSLLLHKLSHLGISSRLFGWLKQYLIVREQQVVIAGTSSSSAEVFFGMLQRSVLGPLLILILSMICAMVSGPMLDCTLMTVCCTALSRVSVIHVSYKQIYLVSD